MFGIKGTYSHKYSHPKKTCTYMHASGKLMRHSKVTVDARRRGSKVSHLGKFATALAFFPL